MREFILPDGTGSKIQFVERNGKLITGPVLSAQTLERMSRLCNEISFDFNDWSPDDE